MLEASVASHHVSSMARIFMAYLSSLILSRAPAIIARKLPGQAFLPHPTAKRGPLLSRLKWTLKRRTFSKVCANSFWMPYNVISWRHTPVIYERRNPAIIDRFPPGPTFTLSRLVTEIGGYLAALYDYLVSVS